MTIEWHIKLIDRIIQGNRDATITDYLIAVSSGNIQALAAISQPQPLPVPYVRPKHERADMTIYRKPIPDEPRKPLVRPPAVYSNRGHLKLIDELAY